MPPRLRGACSIFWLVWITSLSYWLGIWVFESSFGVRSEEMDHAEFVMFAVCVISGSLAFIGCTLLFFDVTHFCCVLLYAIPLGLVVPIVCIAGLVELDHVQGLTNVSVETAVINYWNEHGKSPTYLTRTEKERGCCGIYGPSDYREFIYGRHCESQQRDVPYSCCNLTNLFIQGENVPSKVCSVVASQNLFDPDEDCRSNLTSNTNANDTGVKCQCIKRDTNVAKQFERDIYKQGCVDELLENTQAILDTHFSFFLIFPLLSIIMLVTFLKAWCKSPEVAELSPYYSKSKSSLVTFIVDKRGDDAAAADPEKKAV